MLKSNYNGNSDNECVANEVASYFKYVYCA